MRIYIACPMSTYNTSYYREQVAVIRDYYPDAEFTEVPGLYRDGRHFRETYRTHLDNTDMLIFFAATDGTLGFGVHDEIKYAENIGKPALWLDNSILCDNYTLSILNRGRDWVRYAKPDCLGCDDDDDEPDDYDPVDGESDDSGYGPGSYFEHAMNSDD